MAARCKWGYHTAACCLVVLHACRQVGVWAQLGRGEEGSAACCGAGFVEATVRAMLAAPHEPAAAGLMEEACRAMATLAFADAEGRARLREGGAARA